MNERKKTVLITGGTSGLGLSLVKLFLSKGWNVATFGRRFEKLGDIRTYSTGGNLYAEPCDIRIEKQVENFFSTMKEKFSTLDLLILNAGEIGPAQLPGVIDLKEIDLRMIFETNLFGSYSVLKKSLSIKSTKFIAVHVTSDVVKNTYEGWGGYGSSKIAMDFLIATLNEEGKGHGITALSIDPGDMDTEMHHLVLPGDTDLKKPENSALEILERIELEMTGDIHD